MDGRSDCDPASGRGRDGVVRSGGRGDGSVRAPKLSNKLAQLQRPHLLIIDEAGYVPLESADANRVFQVVNRRYTRGSTIVTSNKTVSRMGRHLRRRGARRRHPRPPTPRRRGARHQRPELPAQRTPRGAPAGDRSPPTGRINRSNHPRPLPAGTQIALQHPDSGGPRPNRPRSAPQSPPSTAPHQRARPSDRRRTRPAPPVDRHFSMALDRGSRLRVH